MKLTELKKGQSAFIQEIKKNDEHAFRLLELGFVSNTKITLLRKSLFHGPMECLIRGYVFALRYQDASLIEVKLC